MSDRDENGVEEEIDDEDEMDFGDDVDVVDDAGDEAEVEVKRSGRRVPVLAIVSLTLLGLFGALIGWLWVSFDESDIAALAPPTVQVEMPPSPAAAPAPAAVATTEGPDEPPAAELLTEEAPPPTLDEAAAEAPAGEAPAPQDEREVAAPAPEPAQPPAPETVETQPPPEPEPSAPSQDVALAAAPDPELLAASPNGPLPVIAPDGLQAWQEYARGFADPDGRPRIAILLGPLGLIESASYSAIQQLPATVTLAFAPYTRNLGDWIAQARAGGHEVILHIPMEPFDYPDSDPGPHTLLTSISAVDNIERLEWLLGRATGYIGISNFMGDRFTSSADHLRPVLEVLKSRGLMFLDAQASRNSVAARVALDLGVPRALNNRFIDSEASRIAIDARLFELERIAKQVGTAVGIGFPYPVTIERIASWAPTLAAKGLILAPLSAVANRQDIQ